MPIEKINLEKDYESGIVNALIKNSEKINEIIDFLNKIFSPIEFKPTGKFFVEVPDSDKAV